MSPAEESPPETEQESQPGTHQSPDPEPGPGEDAAGGELSGLQRMIVGAVAVLISLGMVWHIGATFFHISPQNVVRDEYGPAIQGYLYPEFRQGWNLFAPELPRSDTTVHARAQVRNDDGTTEMTEWVDVSAPDLDHLNHNPLPSRNRHQLRKAWSDVLRWQSEHGDVIGQHGADVRQMAKRIALPRLNLPAGTRPEQIQFRTVTTVIPPPPWVPQAPAEPTYREHPWWPLTPSDLAGGGDR
jgi:hypothetical protein